MKNDIELPTVGLAGRYRLTVRRAGEVIDDTGWFDNLLTDAGLNAFGKSVRLLRYVMVGTGNTPPTAANTTLEAQIASKDGSASPGAVSAVGVETSPPRYGWMRWTYTFPQGAVVGNVNEVGVGWSSTAVASRSLVSPTLTLLAIDQLTVVYELRMYVPMTNATGTVTIGARTYNYTIRAINANSAGVAGSDYRGWVPGVANAGEVPRGWTGAGALVYGAPASVQTDVGAGYSPKVTDGAYETSPTESYNYSSSVNNSAYVDNSLECRFSYDMAIGNANIGPGSVWLTQTSGTAQNLNGVCAGGGKFVAVGNNGVILTTPANETIVGQAWTARSSGVSDALKAVAYGGSLYVAVGANGVILTSSDAVTWTSRTSGVSVSLNAVVFGSGLYLVVGDTGTVLTSTDGTTWTSRTSGTSENLNGATYGGSGGLYVAVGNAGKIITSGDGAAWTSRTSGTAASLLCAAYVNDIYMVGGPSNAILLSDDALSWRTEGPLGYGSSIGSIAKANGFALIALPGAVVLRTVDGVAWEHVAGSGSSSASVYSAKCAFSDDVVVSVGSSGAIQACTGGGIMAISYTAMFGTYLCVFDGVIPKTNTKTFSISFWQKWARRP